MISLYRTKIQLEPWPSSLILRAPTGGYHSFFAGDGGISISRDHQLVQVSLVRNNGASALAGSSLADMNHGAIDFEVDEHLVERGIQQIPLASTAELELGDLLGTSSCPLLREPVASVSQDDGSASAPTSSTPGENYMIVASPVVPPTAGSPPTPACPGPIVHQ